MEDKTLTNKLCTWGFKKLSNILIIRKSQLHTCPNNPLPVLHCPILMCQCKVQSLSPMSFGESRPFFSSPQSSSQLFINCSCWDRLPIHILQNFGGLCDVVNFLKGNLSNGVMNIRRKKFAWTTPGCFREEETMFGANSRNSRHRTTSCSSRFMYRLVHVK